MPILVVGATSQIGYFLLHRLQAAGHPVLALSRREQANALGVQWLQGSIDSFSPQSGLQAVVSFGPLQHVAAWLARHAQAPAPVLVATSSMSVLTKVASVDPGERAVVQQLVQGETAIQRECVRLGMRWVLLRPTLIYGAGRDKSLTPLARRAQRWRLFPAPSGAGLRQPVHADDLAKVVLHCIDDPRMSGVTLHIGGGERLPATQMFRRVQAALPFASLRVPIPTVGLAALAGLVPAIRGPISRLQQDLIADNSVLLRLTGLQPRPFELQSWMLGVGDSWQQRLQASLRAA